MKILNIENVIKYDISENVVIFLNVNGLKRSFVENPNGELLLVGKTLKDKGLTIYKIVLTYVQRITSLFSPQTSSEKQDFIAGVIPKVMAMQQHLDRLSVEPGDFNSYWSLIETLDAVMGFIGSREVIAQRIMN